jgi:hypothetical protein
VAFLRREQRTFGPHAVLPALRLFTSSTYSSVAHGRVWPCGHWPQRRSAESKRCATFLPSPPAPLPPGRGGNQAELCLLPFAGEGGAMRRVRASLEPESTRTGQVGMRNCQKSTSQILDSVSGRPLPRCARCAPRAYPGPQAGDYTHSRRRAQMPSAQRSASAPIVEVGLTAALVVNELPSTINRFLTS